MQSGREGKRIGARQNGKRKKKLGEEPLRKWVGKGWGRGEQYREKSRENKLMELVYAEKTEKRGKEKREGSENMNEYGIVPQVFPAALLNLEGVHAIFKHCVSV